MILDTSALMAILREEEEASGFTLALLEARTVSISAATLVEAGMVAESRGGPEARVRLDALLSEVGPRVVPVTADQAALALDGWRRFGKGRHRAKLNLGDCFAYALAKASGEPLLFKGDDFAHTDVQRAV